MTRKHFEAIAHILDAERAVRSATPAQVGVVHALALSLSDLFAAENPRFDRNRFLTACGVGVV